MLNKIVFTFLFYTLSSNFVHAEFKKIKKKDTVTKPEIIFPIQINKKNCIRDLYIDPDTHYVRPVLKVKAPSGYGLDDRFDHALGKFEDFSFPCSGGNLEACKNVKMHTNKTYKMYTVLFCLGGELNMSFVSIALYDFK